VDVRSGNHGVDSIPRVWPARQWLRCKEFGV
jgi:hypothetical protein